MKPDWTDVIRNKLAEHTETPPESLWEDIESAMKPQKKTNRLRVYTAAACALLFIAMSFFMQETMLPETQMPLIMTETTVEKQTTEENALLEEVPTLVPQKIKAMKKKTALPAHTECWEESKELEERKETEITENTAQTTENKEETNETETSKTTQKKNLIRNHSNKFTPSRHCEKKVIALNFYAKNAGYGKISGNDISLDEPLASPGGNEDYEYDTPPLHGGKPSDEKPTKDKPLHRQPLRIGLGMSYPLTNRLSLNFGLEFVRLSSEIPMEKTQTNIALPIGATFRLTDFRPVNVYLTAGGAVEKCVSGDERRLQYSVFGGAGLQVQVVENISIYAEPIITFYPDNHSQAINFYKDHSADCNVRLGLRFNIDK